MISYTLATVDDAVQLADIAAPIWQEHYTPIIGAEQVAYMLQKFQSPQAIRQQIEQNYQYYIVFYEQQPAGYMALEKRGSSLFISKFYLSSKFRGQGLARHMLKKIHELAEQVQCTQLELTVNKFNPAYAIYLKLGFKNMESIQMDIGNGFIMDDFRMLKSLPDHS